MAIEKQGTSMSVAQHIDISYAEEQLTDSLFDEILPLLVAHQDEVGHYKDIPLHIDQATYQKMAAIGLLAIFSAREAGQLIGYSIYFVSPSLHYSGYTFASSDALYVCPSFRAMSIGRSLIKFAHQQLKKRGVSAVYQHGKHKESLNIGPLFRRLGYEHLDDVWAIRLDKE